MTKIFGHELDYLPAVVNLLLMYLKVNVISIHNRKDFK